MNSRTVWNQPKLKGKSWTNEYILIKEFARFLDHWTWVNIEFLALGPLGPAGYCDPYFVIAS